MPKITTWTYKMTYEHAERLSKPTVELLNEIVAIAAEVNPPNPAIHRAVIYELGLAAVGVISRSLFQICDEAMKQFAKELGTEPSP